MRETTSDEKADLRAQIELRENIDKRYPPTPLPYSAPASKVVDITDNGVLELADGRRVVMDGISCSAEGIAYLRRVTIDASTALAAIPHSSATPTAAEVWTVTTYGNVEGKSYSALAETGLASRWCTPAKTDTNPHNQRYEALFNEFAVLRETQEKLRANKALQPTPSPCGLGRG